MPNLNKVMLMGNLTRDPELRYTPSGAAVCEFGMAINRKWKGKDGTENDEACFVDCTAWGRVGEVVAEYMSKGKPLFVEGHLTFDQWEGTDGKKRSKLKVTAENVQFLGGPADAGRPVGRREGVAARKPDVRGGTGEVLKDDDIPF